MPSIADASFEQLDIITGDDSAFVEEKDPDKYDTLQKVV